MNRQNYPMPGEWFETLPKWKQHAFTVLVNILGSPLALSLFGYRTYLKHWAKTQEEQHGNS